MKTLVLNGSPRRSGDSMTLLNEMKKHLKGDVDIVSAYYDKISPCIDCRYCWTHDECSIKDGMQKIYDQINSYDNVILVSPMHFSELSGMLLAITSRFQVYWCAEFFRNTKLVEKEKNGVLILTGGGGLSTSKPLSTAKMILKHVNAQLIGQILSMDTNNVQAKDDDNALNKARELALSLNSMFEENQKVEVK